MQWSLKSIGVLHSPCKEKFAVPRQSGLAPNLCGHIEILPGYDDEQAFVELEGFSHIWVLGIFDQAIKQNWQTMIRPPRLGGNKRVGVFASRSPYRPNPISLSVYRFDGMQRHNGKLQLHVCGIDMVEGTPILDIKPYLPYADNIQQAQGGYTDNIVRETLAIEFSDEALVQLQEYGAQAKQLKQLIEELLALDPRPAYHTEALQREYGMRVHDFNIRFAPKPGYLWVLSVERMN